MQIQLRQIGPGMVQQIQSACSSCRGAGKTMSEKDKCKVRTYAPKWAVFEIGRLS